MQLWWPLMAMGKSQPNKILLAATGLFASEDDVCQFQRVLGEGAANVIRRIADDVIDAAFAAEKVLDAIELRIATIDQIGGNYAIAGGAGGVSDASDSASWILDNPIEPAEIPLVPLSQRGK